MDLTNLLNLQGEMFLLLLIGAVLRNANILTKESKTTLTDLVIWLVLPCNIINSFCMDFSIERFKAFLVIIIVAISIQAVCFILSRVLYGKAEPGQRKVLQYATLVSNAGFMGNPIAEGVFGAEGLMYASVYLIPQRIVMWSAGIACFTKADNWKNTFRKVVTHPCIVAVYIGLLLMVTGWRPPYFIGTTIKMVGSGTTYLSMILIGTIFADIKWRQIVSPTVIGYTIIRLVLIPLATYIGCTLAGVDPLITGVSVLLAGMPAGSTTAILASKYDGDYQFATKCVVFSTLMTLITVPLWCLII